MRKEIKWEDTCPLDAEKEVICVSWNGSNKREQIMRHTEYV
jgi:hypothetical protein